MALALYRKYRPRTFAEIIGQDHVTEPLSQALRTGRLHHAYLFSGPRGCGKTSSARILARSLNCVKGPTPDPCGECESCIALAPDGPGSIDVIEIDAASHGGVDDARDLRERAFFAPVSSRFKVYVIDEAHMVSPAGFNALLKLVEEPPDYVKFVFATTEPEKVLGTIKSRTHHYPFRLIPPGILRPYLEQMCAAEGVTVQPAVFPLVVRSGGGSARDSLSVLDQLIAGAGPEGVTYARAVALLGVTDVALIDEMCDALAAGDGAAAYATIDRVAEAGHDPRRFTGDLLERLRDLIVLQQVPDAATKGLLGGAADELERMTAQAERFGSATLSRMADIVHTGLVDMRGTTAPRLVLELVTARMLLPGAEDSAAALLQRMERMERRLTLAGEETDPPVRTTPAPVVARPEPSAGPTGAVPTPAAKSVRKPVVAAPATSDEPATHETPATSATRPASAPAAALDAAAVRRIWDEVLTMVRRKSPRAAAVVREATVRDVRGDVLVLLFKHQFHAQALASAPELLIDALYEIIGGRWQVQCEVAGQAGVVVPATASTTGPVRPNTPGPVEVTPAAATAPPTTGRRNGRSEAGGARQRGSDATASEGASTRPTPTAGDPAGGTPVGHATAGDAGGPALIGPATGGSAESGAIATSRAATSIDEDDWPTPATLGGPPPEVAGSGPPPSLGPAADGGQPRITQRATPPAAGAVPGRNGTPRAGIAAARAAAAGGGATSARGGGRRTAGSTPTAGAGRAPMSRTGGGRSASPRDDTWPDSNEEPPYDPEFDGPVASAAHIGFDPGDEPDDDADSETVRQTSEQQALDLLREALGAEKIAEIDNR
jgi:DNA polymerase-3 subunit gamma/tau